LSKAFPTMQCCKVLCYHFNSIYYKHHQFITNEKNYLTLKDDAIKLIVWFCRWKILTLTSVNLYTFVRATITTRTGKNRGHFCIFFAVFKLSQNQSPASYFD
jgi:hypothetical protein